MGGTIEEIIDSLKKGDIMQLDGIMKSMKASLRRRFWKRASWQGWNRFLTGLIRKKSECRKS